MSDSPVAAGDGGEHRLPRTVVPSHYDITLEPDLTEARFDGSCVIDIDVQEPVGEIVLNAAELEIDDAVLVRGGEEAPLGVVLDDGRERARLTPDRPLDRGPATLRLTFRGTLNDQLRGFYRSIYRDADGDEQVIATTQLESTDARRAFPCWDEPDLKATFDVTLVVADGLTAISNSPEAERTTLDDGRHRVRFARTMKMSTYLLAFIVGRLEATEPRMAGSTPIRVVAPPGKLHLADFALECAEFCLGWFERYYGIPYPGLKVDLIAIPDFAAGAMENLGAITFRENALLVDPGQATRSELARVADVVAHELAHMWFGDLVTMKWWNGIWLNEAFATFMELCAVDAFRPDWGRWITQRADAAGAFEIDALPGTRAIEFPVHAPEDAEGMFDVLTYFKGASVLRMLEQYLGEDRFRAGVRHYLDAHAYGNTETTDLWDSLEEATGEPCRRLMDSWIFTGGFPLVTVARGDTPRRVEVRQRPAAQGIDPDPGRRWLVPVMLRTHHPSGTSEHRILLEDDAAVIEVADEITTVVANAGGHGFYRVRYDAELLDAVLGVVDAMDSIERLALVDDTWAGVLAGTTDAATFVDMAGRFDRESHFEVWSALTGVMASSTGAMRGLLELMRVLEPSDRPLLAARIRALTAPMADKLGWEPAPGEPDDVRLTRGCVLRGRGDLGGDEETIARARQALKLADDDHDAVDAEVRAAAVQIVAAHADDEDHDAFAARYQAAATPQDEMRFLYALADCPGAERAQRTLALCFSDAVRTQNAPLAIRRLLLNIDLAVGRATWEAVKQHWDEVEHRFPRNLVSRMLEGVRALSTPELRDDVAAFLDEHPVPQAARTVEQIRQRLDVNVALRARESDRLGRRLRE